MEIRKFRQHLGWCPGTCKAGWQVESSAKLMDRAMEDGIEERSTQPKQLPLEFYDTFLRVAADESRCGLRNLAWIDIQVSFQSGTASG